MIITYHSDKAYQNMNILSRLLTKQFSLILSLFILVYFITLMKLSDNLTWQISETFSTNSHFHRVYHYIMRQIERNEIENSHIFHEFQWNTEKQVFLMNNHLCVSHSVKKIFLKQAHDNQAHNEINRTIECFRLIVFILFLKTKVCFYVKHCLIC